MLNLLNAHFVNLFAWKSLVLNIKHALQNSKFLYRVQGQFCCLSLSVHNFSITKARAQVFFLKKTKRTILSFKMNIVTRL